LPLKRSLHLYLQHSNRISYKRSTSIPLLCSSLYIDTTTSINNLKTQRSFFGFFIMSLLSDLINLNLSDSTEKIIAEYLWYCLLYSPHTHTSSSFIFVRECMDICMYVCVWLCVSVKGFALFWLASLILSWNLSLLELWDFSIFLFL
jgi:hypothetical protein